MPVGKGRRGKRGVALIMVLVLMTVLASFAATNATVLAGLRRFLSQVEREHVERLRAAEPAGR